MSVSVGGTIAKENVMTNDKPEQSFEEALEEMRQAENCRLFSPGPDFTIACSCGECHSKVTKLKRFEDEIKSKKTQLYDYLAQVNFGESLCLSLVNTAKWTVDLLDLLLRRVEALSEKLGIPLKLEKDAATANLETVFLRLAHMLKDNGVIRNMEIPEYDEEHYNSIVSLEIAAGVSWYKQTKANGRASALLHVMAQVEDDHEREKKAAEAEGKVLAPSISKCFIEKQIELVKTFPVEELYVEAEEIVSKICPIEEKTLMGREIRMYITSTSRAMIVERKRFWQQYRESAGIKHDLNGLNKTLDSLLIMVDMFKKQWEKKYGSFVAPFDRSDPKRPRIADF